MAPRIINKAAPTLPIGTRVVAGDIEGEIVLVRRRKFAKRYGVAFPQPRIDCALLRRDELRVR